MTNASEAKYTGGWCRKHGDLSSGPCPCWDDVIEKTSGAGEVMSRTNDVIRVKANELFNELDIRGADQRASIVCALSDAQDAGYRAAIQSQEQLVAALKFYVAICCNTAWQVSRESAQEAYKLATEALALAAEIRKLGQ